MSKILDNTTGSPISISDTGVTVDNVVDYTIPATEYAVWAASSDIITEVGAGNIVVKSGATTLSKSDGIDLLKGIDPTQVDTTTNGLITVINDAGTKRLAVDVKQTGTSPNDYLGKVSANDTTGDYLLNKIVAADESNSTNAVEIKEVNDAGDEDLKIAFDETKVTVTKSQVSDFVEADYVHVTGNETVAGNKSLTGTTTKLGGTVASSYTASIQTTAADTWLEILNSGGTNKGVFFGITGNSFQLWNYQGGAVDFYTAPTASSGVLRFTIGNDGVVTIHGLGAGVVKASSSGVLSSETENTGFNKNFGSSAGTVAEGNDSRFHDNLTLGGVASDTTDDTLDLSGQELTVNLVTTSTDGAMSAADKTKLDGVATGANNYSHPNHTGDVTSSGDGAQTIANDVVTNAKLANMATQTFKGRTTAATGDPEDLTATQATAMLNNFTSSLKGLAPSSGGGTTNYLRADGTWAAPAGGVTNTSYTAAATDEVSTTLNSMTTVPDMVITTPPAGTYLVTMHGEGKSNSGNKISRFSVGNLNNAVTIEDANYTGFCCVGIVTVNGSTDIVGKFVADLSATAYARRRQLTAVRLV